MLVLLVAITGSLSVMPVMAADDDDIIFLYPEYNPLPLQNTTDNENISIQSSNNKDLSGEVIDNCIGGDEPWENEVSSSVASNSNCIGGDEPWENKFDRKNLR